MQHSDAVYHSTTYVCTCTNPSPPHPLFTHHRHPTPPICESPPPSPLWYCTYVLIWTSVVMSNISCSTVDCLTSLLIFQDVAMSFYRIIRTYPCAYVGGHALDVPTCQDCVSGARPPGTRSPGRSLLAVSGALRGRSLQTVLQVRVASVAGTAPCMSKVCIQCRRCVFNVNPLQ